MALNKIKYGLKNVHVAKLTKGDDGTFTYATPRAIPGAVSLSMDAEGEMTPFHADNIVYFRTVSNNGYTGDLEMALVPDWFREEILQEVKDSKGVLVETANVTDVVYFALLFQFEGDKKAIRHVLYNCTAAENTIEGQTKGENIEVQPETLTITAKALPNGGPVKPSSFFTFPATAFAKVFISKLSLQPGRP